MDFSQPDKNMAKKLTIKLDTSKYKTPSQEELDAAKQYVVRTNNAANAMREIAEDEITDTAAELVKIADKYNIDPQRFAFDSDVSEPMMDEVAAVMDNLEDSLMRHLEDYTTKPTTNDGSHALIWAFVLALGHRNMGMRQTLHQYLWRTLRQTEALIAAGKTLKLPQQQIISNVRSDLANMRGSRMFNAIQSYRHLFDAQFIRNGGMATYSDGTPNAQGVPTSGLTAILNTLGGAVTQAWRYAEQQEMQQNGAIGYWQFRGSDYPCDSCDEETGFHELGDREYDPYPHPHCMCGRIPIYKKQELDNMTI